MRGVILSCVLATMPCVAAAQSTEDQIAEALLAAPESLRAGATVIARDTQGRPNIIRPGTNELVCETDGPQPGFGVECYHTSFQGVMDWMSQRLAEGARTFTEMFAGGGPEVEISPGAMTFIPKHGPSDGSRKHTTAFLPIRFKPSFKPTEVVVLPSPAGVGVIAVTRISLPSGRSSNDFR